MTRSITIELTAGESTMLRVLADIMLRTEEAQLRYLIHEAAEARGVGTHMQAVEQMDQEIRQLQREAADLNRQVEATIAKLDETDQ